MARILFCWELGNNYGHLSRLIPIALAQLEVGNDVSFLLSNMQAGDELLKAIGLNYYQAPKFNSNVSQKLSYSYGSMLLSIGYADKVHLRQAVRNWLNLINSYKPDLIVADHSPTVLLTNKISKIPIIQVGGGFEIPPNNLWQNLFSFNESPHQEILKSDQLLLENMNDAIITNGGIAMSSSSQLFDGCKKLIASFEELDHHQNRSETNYIGPIYDLEIGIKVNWSSSGARRIFLYAWPNLAGLNQLIKALSQLDVEVIAVIPNISDEALSFFENSFKKNVRVFTEPVKLDAIIGHADLLITHSGFGTVSAFLKQGVPILIVPDNLERYVIGQCIEALGVGLVLREKRTESAFKEMILFLLEATTFRLQATKFSKKYAYWKPDYPVKELTYLINNLLQTTIPDKFFTTQ